MQESKIKTAGDIKETVKSSRYEINSELLTGYIKKLITHDLENIVNYCYGWGKVNEKQFTDVQPQDLVFKVLEAMAEGRRKCYTKTYRHFKNSVYFHLKYELLSFFNYRKKEDLAEDDYENYFTENKADNYYDEGCYADEAGSFLGELEDLEIRERIINLFDPNDDVEEILVMEELFKGNKRKDIAAVLQLPAGEITNILKRIVRKLKKHNIKKLLEGEL